MSDALRTNDPVERESQLSDAGRDYWLNDTYSELHVAIRYAETAQLQAEVGDVGGIRRAVERLIAHVKLAAWAVKKIEKLDAEAAESRAA